jgi:hypothetical protein
MFIRVEDELIALEDIRTLQDSPGGRVQINWVRVEPPTLYAGEKAKLLKFCRDYILPGLGMVRDISEQYVNKDAIIMAHAHQTKMNQERMLELAEAVKAQADGKPVMDSEGNIIVPANAPFVLPPRGEGGTQ